MNVIAAWVLPSIICCQVSMSQDMVASGASAPPNFAAASNLSAPGRGKRGLLDGRYIEDHLEEFPGAGEHVHDCRRFKAPVHHTVDAPGIAGF